MFKRPLLASISLPDESQGVGGVSLLSEFLKNALYLVLGQGLSGRNDMSMTTTFAEISLMNFSMFSGVFFTVKIDFLKKHLSVFVAFNYT